MIGETFARLTVVAFSHSDQRSRRWWVCRCLCGSERVLHTGSLRSGNTRSCGCLSRESRLRRISVHHSDITAVILGYKRHAMLRGHEWELERGTVVALIQKSCFYCGAPPKNLKRTKNSIAPFYYNGIDRIDNTAGYTPGNVVACCRICNRAKETLTVQEFAEWAGRLAAMAEQWSGDAPAIVQAEMFAEVSA